MKEEKNGFNHWICPNHDKILVKAEYFSATLRCTHQRYPCWLIFTIFVDMQIVCRESPFQSPSSRQLWLSLDLEWLDELVDLLVQRLFIVLEEIYEVWKVATVFLISAGGDHDRWGYPFFLILINLQPRKLRGHVIHSISTVFVIVSFFSVQIELSGHLADKRWDGGESEGLLVCRLIHLQDSINSVD